MIPGSESVADQRSFPYTPNHQINAGLTYTDVLDTETSLVICNDPDAAQGTMIVIGCDG